MTWVAMILALISSQATKHNANTRRNYASAIVSDPPLARTRRTLSQTLRASPALHENVRHIPAWQSSEYMHLWRASDAAMKSYDLDACFANTPHLQGASERSLHPWLRVSTAVKIS